MFWYCANDLSKMMSEAPQWQENCGNVVKYYLILCACMFHSEITASLSAWM